MQVAWMKKMSYLLCLDHWETTNNSGNSVQTVALFRVKICPMRRQTNRVLSQKNRGNVGLLPLTNEQGSCIFHKSKELEF